MPFEQNTLRVLVALKRAVGFLLGPEKGRWFSSIDPGEHRQSHRHPQSFLECSQCTFHWDQDASL